jgi:hypothetical protein
MPDRANANEDRRDPDPMPRPSRPSEHLVAAGAEHARDLLPTVALFPERKNYM